jgi:hypothetical protein
MIATVNLMGRIFVSKAAIAEFDRRALAGEFAKPHRVAQARALEGSTTRL